MIYVSFWASGRLENRDPAWGLLHPEKPWVVPALGIAPSFREFVESFDDLKPAVEALYERLCRESIPLRRLLSAHELTWAPILSRTFLFADGSTYMSHVVRVRKSRNAPIPEDLYQVPLIYQAESSWFLGPFDPIVCHDPEDGLDFEGEVAVITRQMPVGVGPEEALKGIVAITLLNDVSLRQVALKELARGFGFYVSKPHKALSFMAISPQLLGQAWLAGQLRAVLKVWRNQELWGELPTDGMQFHFGQLIAHMAQRRQVPAAALVGSGTVSHEDERKGFACLVERRLVEQMSQGRALTSYLVPGDEIRLELEVPGIPFAKWRLKQSVVAPGQGE